ncbi:MAG: NADH-quinone oxidoreductase subunit H [bacterium]
MTGYFFELAQVLLALALAPGLVGFTRWVKARLQNRRGAPPWQPYFELRKLFGKEVVRSNYGCWLLRFAPYLVFGSTVASLEDFVFALDHHTRLTFLNIVHQHPDFLLGTVAGFPELAQDALEVERENVIGYAKIVGPFIVSKEPEADAIETNGDSFFLTGMQ